MLVDALLALAILIALLGIGNTLARSILERTRELGVLLDTIIVRSVLATTSGTSATGCGGQPSWHANQTPHQPNSARNAPPP